MCPNHSTLIDDPAQGFTVEDVVQMKRSHESAMEDVRLEQIAGRSQSVSIEGHETVVQTVILGDAPRWQRKAMNALAKEDPGELRWLLQRAGEPADPEHLSDLVSSWPDELKTASGPLLNALARTAESSALWDVAATVWERWAAQLSDDGLRADHLVRAAQDADVAGDHHRRGRLLEQAEAIDPDAPRLRLEQLTDSTPPEVQLRVLEEIESTDPALSSMIYVRRARAAMLLPDLDAAGEYLSRAAELDPDSMAVRATGVNLVVQRARIALSADRAFPLVEMRQAQSDALELRDEFAEMARWAESGSMLMLAADASGVMRDAENARALLEEALPAELEVSGGAEVLGEAALRAGAPSLVLRFTKAAAQSDAIRRIRATAEIDIGGPARETGLEVLEELARGGGPEAEFAAFARLGVCMPPVLAAWNEEVAEVLSGGPHDRILQSLRILTLARSDVEQAWEQAEDLPEEVWAGEIRLRVAGVSRNKDRMQEAAEDFLRFSPDASGRLLSAQALGQAGSNERAREVSADVAADLNAPPRVRAELEQWTEATRRWEEWQRLSFTELPRPDPRVSAWQVRVAHHQLRAKTH
jgi:tetratricopeptide (TPR) repeat protein